MKVLPELLKAVEFGAGGPKAFGVVMKIAVKLSESDFDIKFTPAVIRLFGNPDRAIRVCLLDNLPLMIDRLSHKTVNDKIFPQIVSSFEIPTLQMVMLTVTSGFRVHRRSTPSSRADLEISAHADIQTLGSNNKRRVAKIPS